MKIKTQDEIKKIAEVLRDQGKAIVTINGSFDLLHIGHVKILQEAKKQGDVLIVGLNSDISVKKYKGETRPIIAQQYRAEMLAALECVDYVVLFDQEEIAIPLIELVKPSVHVNGKEYGENCVEAETLSKIGAKLHLVDNFEGFSTSNLIERISGIFKQRF